MNKTTAFFLQNAFFFYVCDVELSYAKIYAGCELEKKNNNLKTDEEFSFLF